MTRAALLPPRRGCAESDWLGRHQWVRRKGGGICGRGPLGTGPPM